MKRLGFGCMRLPLKDANDGSSVDYEKTKELFDYYISRGYTYFDTAFIYHGRKGEEAVRECLVKRYPRDKFTITTKMFYYELKNEEEAEKMLQVQLDNLGVDYIDYYWLHSVKADNIQIAENANLFEFIAKKKAEGKIKHIGFSYHDKAELLDEILTKHPEIEFVQLQINYLDWNSPSVQGKANYEVCCKHNVPVIVMEPIKGGTLANIPKEAEDNFKAYKPDLTSASWALRFVANLDNVYMILSGMNEMDQVIDNCNTFDSLEKLNKEEEELIKKNTLIIQNTYKIPCTACRYCCDGCPIKVAIPEYFEMVNNPRATKKGYEALAKEGFAKASECIKCGQCEAVCPQHLPIRDYLENEVVKAFEKD